MVGQPNAVLSTTFAVLRPTPGKASSAARSSGTSPPCCSSRIRQVLMTFSALLLNRPMVFDIGLHAFHAQLQHGFWRIGDRIEQGSGFIDAHIGRLCREQHRDQQLKRGGKVQLRRRCGFSSRRRVRIAMRFSLFMKPSRLSLPERYAQPRGAYVSHQSGILSPASCQGQ